MPGPDSDARITKMIDCLAAMLPQKPSPNELAGMRRYVQDLIADNEPGAYEVTASYRATTWSKRTSAVVSPPMRFVVDEGIDGYQQFCDRFSEIKKKP